MYPENDEDPTDIWSPMDEETPPTDDDAEGEYFLTLLLEHLAQEPIDE